MVRSVPPTSTAILVIIVFATSAGLLTKKTKTTNCATALGTMGGVEKKNSPRLIAHATIHTMKKTPIGMEIGDSADNAQQNVINGNAWDWFRIHGGLNGVQATRGSSPLTAYPSRAACLRRACQGCIPEHADLLHSTQSIKVPGAPTGSRRASTRRPGSGNRSTPGLSTDPSRLSVFTDRRAQGWTRGNTLG